jgi:hypothetical protein
MAPADGSATWLRPDGDGVLVFVHLQPGARRTAAAGLHGGRLKVAVAAPPLDGRANEALARWIAGQLDLPPSRVRLVAGARSRDKTLRVDGADAGQALRRLAPQ